MGKVQGSFIEPVHGRREIHLKNHFYSFIETVRRKFEFILLRKGLLFFLFGFMLGRAFILSMLSPFSLPFFAAAYYLKRDKSQIVFLGIIAGALTVSVLNAVYSFVIISLFLIIQRILKSFTFSDIKVLPVAVFGAVFAGRTAWYYAETMDLTLFNLLASVVEGGLAFVLTLIFLQSLPLLLFTKRRESLKTEELVCFVILLASMLTGTIGWMFEGLSVASVLSRYLVLIFAFIAGAAVGSTVGVITGLIFGLASIESIPDMSLLAFGGLLGGLLKEGTKSCFFWYDSGSVIGLYEGGTVRLWRISIHRFWHRFCFF